MEVAARTEGLRSYEWAPRYSTSSADLISSFYKPAMERAFSYDRAVGFFRSSFFSIAGAPTASFALRGGRIRLLCSPDLTEDDAAAIKRGLELRAVVDEAARRELDHVLQYPLAREGVELLAALVAEEALEIRFGLRREGRGMFHDKIGVFTDRFENSVSFSGSVNETWQGWHPLGNHESFEVFLSWEAADQDRVDAHAGYFDRLWHGRADGVVVLEAPQAFRERLLTYAPPRERGESRITIRSRPQPRTLFDHQRTAIQNWEEAGYQGILQHATGSGKTLTALHAVRDWLVRTGPALIVVPSTLLVEQWYREAERELAILDPSILLAGGGHHEWKRSGLLKAHTEPGPAPRITIATVQTAASERFIDMVRGGSHLLFVADEVHRLGSPKFRAVLAIQSGGQLGLSATPDRSGDEEGTAALERYFGPVIDPVFTIHDAIAAGRLTPYEYHVHIVDLSAHEIEQYVDLTAKIGKAFGVTGRDGASAGYLEHLLIQRARIVKQASAKIDAAARIVIDGFQDGQHWLVYCDDTHQVRAILALLRDQRVDAFEYHSAMTGDRDATMAQFRSFGGILVAIRCLDEGIDVPEVTHAVIVASSRTLREFIQRRGRVLRVAPGKHLALVHDLLVAPPQVERDEKDPFASLAEAEIARAATFARDAVNVATRARLVRLCIEWGIDPDVLV